MINDANSSLDALIDSYAETYNSEYIALQSIDKQLTAEFIFLCSQFQKELSENPFGNKGVPEPSYYLSFENVYTYFSACTYLRLRLLKLNNSLQSKLVSETINIEGEVKSVLAWTCLFEMFQIPDIKFSNKELNKLVSKSLQYTSIVKPVFWSLSEN